MTQPPKLPNGGQQFRLIDDDIALQPGLHLYTKDGRTHGNAIVVNQESNGAWVCQTERGNQVCLPEPEVRAAYHLQNANGERNYSPVDEWCKTFIPQIQPEQKNNGKGTCWSCNRPFKSGAKIESGGVCDKCINAYQLPKETVMTVLPHVWGESASRLRRTKLIVELLKIL